MTIEEKIRETIFNFGQLTSKYPDKKDLLAGYPTFISVSQYEDLTQAILALIKPMSREKLIEAITDKVAEWDIYNGQFYPSDLADAILAEWEKGLK